VPATTDLILELANQEVVGLGAALEKVEAELVGQAYPILPPTALI